MFCCQPYHHDLDCHHHDNYHDGDQYLDVDHDDEDSLLFSRRNLLIMGIMSIKGVTVHRNLFITKTFNSADFFSSQKERNFRNFSRFMTRKKFSRIESLGDEKISMIQIEMEIYFVMSNKS